jgi:hypothetical protein
MLWDWRKSNLAGVCDLCCHVQMMPVLLLNGQVTMESGRKPTAESRCKPTAESRYKPTTESGMNQQQKAGGSHDMLQSRNSWFPLVTTTPRISRLKRSDKQSSLPCRCSDSASPLTIFPFPSFHLSFPIFPFLLLSPLAFPILFSVQHYLKLNAQAISLLVYLREPTCLTLPVLLLGKLSASSA